jgi:xanthine/uracil/vitamin C permease (AzgA family)
MDRFQLAAHGTTVRTEVIAGLTTFLTMAYIIFVQPAVLGARASSRRSSSYLQGSEAAQLPGTTRRKAFLLF